MLDRVAEGVPKVENRAAARFAFVFGNDLGLEFAGTLNRMCKGLRVAGKQRLHVVFEPRKEFRVADGAVLDDLGDAGPELAIRQRRQRVGVDENDLRLVKRPDKVLALFVIDARLAADRGVDLGQQRRGHLDEGHATHVASGRESGDIADDAATERKDRRIAIGACPDELVEDRLHRGNGLVCLAVRQRDTVRGFALEVLEQAVEVERPDRLIGDHEAIAAAYKPGQVECAAQQALPDHDRVAAVTEFDCEGGGHGRGD